MIKKVNDIYNQVEYWNSKDIRRLISDLETLAEDKEEYEKEKGE